MVNNHPDERACCKEGIHLAEGSLCDSGFDIGRQMVIEDPMVFAEENLGQFMTFKRAEEK